MGGGDEIWASIDALEKLVMNAIVRVFNSDDATWLINEMRAVFMAAKGMRGETCECQRKKAAEVLRQLTTERNPEVRAVVRGRRPRRRFA